MESNLSDLKILIAEDNEVNQIVTFEMLNMLGIRPDIAEDGVIAIEKHNQNKYDLIFMDMLMPNMDGIEATKTIKKTDDKVIIIAMTANLLFEEDIENCKNAGMVDYISKPFQLNDLKNILSKWKIN